MNKKELLAALEGSHNRVLEAIEDLTPQQMLEPGVVGDWSIKDILAHLARWEAELVKLLWQAHQGIKPSSVHTDQISVDEVNARWQLEDRDRPLERILNDFNGVRQQTIRRLDYFTDQDLNTIERYRWLEGRALWEWIATDSFDHDLEHLVQINAWLDKKVGQGV